MKVLLLHSSFWPMPGGAERTMRQQAEELALLGHEVTVVCGEGSPSRSSYKVVNLPELASTFPLLLRLRKVLDNGQTDGNLTQYTRLLTEKLTPFVQAADLVITHGALTTHFNLSLTAALRPMADTKPFLAWAHDFTPTNPDYSLPFTDRMPWALMFQGHPKVTYIAPSELRRMELAETFHFEPHAIPIIPYAIDIEALYGVEPPLSEWLRAKRILEKDIVFYMPGSLSQRKNLEFACQILTTVREGGLDPALVLTAPTDPAAIAANPYLNYAKFLPTQMGVGDAVYFIADDIPVNETIWRQLLQLCDVVLNTSRYEAFGYIRFEAALTRTSCWTMELPAYSEIPCPRHRLIPSTAAAFREAQALAQTPDFVARKTLQREFSPFRIYSEKVDPLLTTLLATHSP
ncbi:MAG: hypothetical protein OHK005_03430 [Candidatus Methylacidiphilales bacterium]